MLIIKKYIISGRSMNPTINPGDVVFASSLPYFFRAPKNNEIIICKNPRSGRIIVKRITKIDKEKYFVSGDNISGSSDSRLFGYLLRKDIIGKVIHISIKDIKILGY